MQISKIIDSLRNKIGQHAIQLIQEKITEPHLTKTEAHQYWAGINDAYGLQDHYHLNTIWRQGCHIINTHFRELETKTNKATP